jgi:fatty acid desaturase
MVERDPAERRLWAMTAVRLLGLGIVLLGFWLVGRVQGAGLPAVGGLLVILAGLLVFLFVPKALARRWRA